MLRSILMLALATLVCTTQAATSRDLGEGLIAHYSFDGNAQDLSGNGNHGTPNATTLLTTDRFDNPDAAYLFNGIDSRISVPASLSLDSADTASTQAAWIQITGWSQVGQAFGPILMKSDSSANGFMYRLSTSASGLGVAYGNWNIWALGDYVFDFDTWYFVAAAWDGQSVRFYVNGLLIEEAPLVTSLVQDSRPLVIGSDPPGALETFWGKIDDVHIYNRALSSAEIAELGGFDITSVITTPLAGVELANGYPNPFGSSTMIRFRLAKADAISIDVFDLAGRRVRQLLWGDFDSGEGVVVWDGRDHDGRALPSGLYHYRMRTMSGAQASGRVVLRR